MSTAVCAPLEETEKAKKKLGVQGGTRSETDGRDPPVSASVNLMRSPSYQSTVGAMKNDIK